MTDETLKYDRFGHCVKCHKGMLEEKVVDGPKGMEVVKRFTADKDRLQVMLSDGSLMGVSICKPCKALVTEKDYPYIMEVVYRGWDRETDGLVATGFQNKLSGRKWDKKLKKDYMKRMRKLEIVTNAERTDPNLLKDKLQRFKAKKEKK